MNLRLVRDLPLFWKLQLPFATLILIVGAFGAFLIVRNLSQTAESTLRADLHQASLDATALLLSRELYLLESANLAANLQGMAEAVPALDAVEVDRLLQTVLALKGELDLLTTVTVDHQQLVGYLDAVALGNAPPTATSGTFVDVALSDPSASRHAGFLTISGSTVLAIAAPVCAVLEGCVSSGAAIVGQRLEGIAQDMLARIQAGDRRGGVTLFDDAGRVLASAGAVPGQPTSVRLPPGSLIRQTESVDGEEVHTLYAPLAVQGTPHGLVAISLPTAPVFEGVRDAAGGLIVILLIALTGIMGLGGLVSRWVLAQVRPLMATNRALGAGDLSARAPVSSDDEIGQLAVGLNQMAEQLEASYETLESRVQQRTGEVQRLLEERTQFFASLSHELRTPLAVILSEADLLLDGSDPETLDTGRSIKQSAGQLLTAVNDVLEVARDGAGEVQVCRVPLPLGRFLAEFAPTIQALARGGAVRAAVEVPADMPTVLADPTRLREAVLNLIDNAVKYTPDGGSVTLLGRHRDGMAEIAVADTGIGIPDDAGDRVFEPFYRVQGHRPLRGMSSSGLGLALAKRLVDAHGGTLRYVSAPGVGTTFTIMLPCVPQRAADGDRRVQQADPPPPPPPTPPTIPEAAGSLPASRQA